MDERILQFRVGVMVAATVLVTAILVTTFGDLPDLFYGSKTYHVWVEEAPGVQSETPIRKSGVLVGRVAEVQLAGDYPKADAEEAAAKLGMSLQQFRTGVVITAAIRGDRGVFADETFVVNATLLGDVVVEVKKADRTPGDGGVSPAGHPAAGRLPSRAPSSPVVPTVSLRDATTPDRTAEPLPPGAWIRGGTDKGPTEGLRKLQDELPRLFQAVARTSDELNELIGSVNNLLTENRDNIDQAIQQTSETMKSVGRLADSAEEVIGDADVQRQFREALERLPNVLGEVHETVISVQGTVGKMNTSLDHIENFTRPLGQRGEHLVDGLDGSIAKLDQLFDELVQFTRAMNNRQGSLGRLIHDPTLYDNLNRTVTQVRGLTRKLEPILDDARVFSDKVARHPGVIVRDAVRPGRGLK